MVALLPFRVVRPPADMAQRLVAPPYDVVDRDEAAALAAGNPESFLHVTRPEIDLPDDVDPRSAVVYARGAAVLAGLLASGRLVQDDAPGLLVYRLRHRDAQCTGVVGCASVAEYRAGVLAVHERTRPDKEADRADHADALEAHVEPVMVMHRGGTASAASVAGLLARVTEGHGDGTGDETGDGLADAPVCDVRDLDGARHTLWAVPDPLVEPLLAAFAQLHRWYVADGHHRSAAAAVVAERRGDAGESGAFPVVAFPADELTILGYHRVVADLAGLTPAAFVDALRESFDVRPSASAVEPTEPLTVGVHVDGQWFEATLRPDLVDDTDPVARLGVSVLQHRVLAPLLGVSNPRTDPRLGFVGGSRGTAELERLVAAGSWAVAFTLHPTSAEDVMAVSDAGACMPPKSTWFHPKLASGLVVHLMRDAVEGGRPPPRGGVVASGAPIGRDADGHLTGVGDS